MMYEETTRFFSISLVNFLLIWYVFNSAHALSNYDQTVLVDSPVAYWSLAPSDPNDYSGNGLNGVYNNTPSATTTPNGDTVSAFNGVNQYFTTADNNYLEIVRTGILTIAAWFRPDTLQFVYEEGTGYVWWMGKGETNQQSWAARMYSYNNSEGRYNRISGYAFNLTGGLGSGSYFQDNVTVGQWIFYTLVINTVNISTPYPAGYTKIFKNGIQRDQDSLLSFSVVPANGTAPMRVGTRQLDSFFQGGIGKVAVFDYEVSTNQLQTYYNCMIMNTNCRSTQTSLSTTYTTNTTMTTNAVITTNSTMTTNVVITTNATTMVNTGNAVNVAYTANTAPVTWKCEMSVIWFWVIRTVLSSILRW